MTGRLSRNYPPFKLHHFVKYLAIACREFGVPGFAVVSGIRPLYVSPAVNVFLPADNSQ